MKTLFLDIETLPADESDAKAIANLKYLHSKKPEKNKAGADKISWEEYYLNTSFDGGFGRVLCVALAINDDDVKCYVNDGNEKKTLEQFWDVAKQCDMFVGHNLFGFDLPFIYERSVVLGVKPTKDINFARYKSYPIFDTMQEWSKWGWTKNMVTLEYLALALGIPTPKAEGIDGSQVFNFYKKGEIDKISEYCKRDVETVRSIYNKMIFK